MDTEQLNSDSLDEKQSLRVIREMIQVSQKKLRNDGVLFIVWGWISFICYFFLSYLPRVCITTHQIMQFVRPLSIVLPLLGLAFTLYYILKQRKKVQTYIGISLRYIWITLAVCNILTNLVVWAVLNESKMNLQNPIFMIEIAFALIVTGGILRYKMIVTGGIIFGILACIAAYLKLEDQMLLEAIAWVFGFIIPGHILYSQRKS